MRETYKRVIEEQENLQDKIDKLFIFLSSENYKNLGINSRCLLDNQYKHMSEYNNVLIKRIFIMTDLLDKESDNEKS